MAASTAAAAIAAYSLSSIIMVILNKKLVSEYSFKLPTALLIYQNSCAVLALMTMKRLGAVTFDNFSWNTARKWLPVNVSFVSMLTTGFFRYVYLQLLSR
jgi:GDP-mannose transporter